MNYTLLITGEPDLKIWKLYQDHIFVGTITRIGDYISGYSYVVIVHSKTDRLIKACYVFDNTVDAFEKAGELCRSTLTK